MFADLWEWISRTNPDAWAAGAGWTTALIAIIASAAAFRQVREARALREEQAQPYVVAFIEPSETSVHLLDLVVKNFGTTVARDVRIDTTPRLRRSVGRDRGVEEVRLFEVLPVLVPGQEWRIFLDSLASRKDADLPSEYAVKVTYRDSHGRAMDPIDSVLDISAFAARMAASTYGIHHTAQALREIKDIVKRWGETGGRGMAVYVRNGDKRDKRKMKMYREWERSAKALETSKAPVAVEQRASVEHDQTHDGAEAKDESTA